MVDPPIETPGAFSSVSTMSKLVVLLLLLRANIFDLQPKRLVSHKSTVIHSD